MTGPALQGPAYDYEMSVFLPNLRDVGGMDAAEGKVRTGRLLRSALPYMTDLIPEDITWPPTKVIDLRSEREFLHEPHHPLAPTGVEILNFPLISALRPGVAPPSSLAELYQLMLQTTSEHLVSVVDAISISDGPTLVHCAVGKDRTGVSVAMVLSLLGADRDQIIADYLETERNTHAIVERLIEMKSKALPTDDDIPPTPAEFLQTPIEAIEGVLDTWNQHPGGPVDWFRSWGGTFEIVDRLRERMIE